MTGGATMRAIFQDRYGGPEVLQFGQVPVPEAGPGEVLVRIRAAGIHQGDAHLMTGLPYLGRLALGLRRPKVPIRGMDLAGVVERVGAGVTRFAEGDAVFGWCDGSFADLARVRETHLVPLPHGVSFEAAATAPTSGITALQALRDKAKVQPGQRVLVTGAGGGVGTFAVQLARAMGAEVTGVCSTAKVELVRSLGAREVFDHTAEDFTQSGRQWDVILDIAGLRPLAELRRVLAPSGTLVFVGGEGGGDWFGGLERQLGALFRAPFASQRFVPFLSLATYDDLVELARWIEEGKVRPALDRVFPLEEGADAMRYLATGKVRGKIALSVGAGG